MKDILVIFTGGTIGSSIKKTADGEKNIISMDGAASSDIIRNYEDETGKTSRFECINPFSILSEDMVPQKDWMRLIKVISDIKTEMWRGIIITHGTDSLAYSAALLGTLFKNKINCPIVFAAANLPPEDINSNAHINFTGAVKLIDFLSGNKDLIDIYTVWKAKDSFNVYRAVELLSADTSTDDLRSFSGPFAEFYPAGLNMSGTSYDWRLVLSSEHKDSCLAFISDEEALKIIECQVILNAGVMFIPQYPGLDYDAINIEKADAILVYTYHSGTLCTGDGIFSFPEFAAKCEKMKKRLYVASFKKDKEEVYVTTEKFKNKGIIQIFDMSPEAAYVNCLIKESVRINS